jgi:DeoR/GlpR family transcriptional regulator of sugar metabolism
MLAEKRKQLILETLEKEGSVRTIDLAQRMNVADETIRRDLELLAGEKLIKRAHGGAVRIASEKIESSYDERRVRNIDEKMAVAREALKYIETGDCIYLDASSTVLQLVPLLGAKSVTVVTNSLMVANAMSKLDRVELIITGGTLHRQSYGFIGPAALRSLERYSIDKMFCSGNGIHSEYGLTEINEWQSCLKEVAVQRSAFKCFLGDSSKPGAFSSYCFAPCESFDVLITTETADKEAFGAIGKRGPRIVTTVL